jgi:hypothetical protein
MSHGMNWHPFAATSAALAICACTSETENHNSVNNAKVEVSDCYKQAGSDFSRPQSQRALFVVVDQTTGLDDHLRETIGENTKQLLEPGTQYAIYTFSAYSRDRYFTPVVAGEIVASVAESDRESLPTRRLNRLDKCLSAATEKAVSQVEGFLEEATEESSSNFSNSEIMSSLKHVDDAVQESEAKDKLVIIVSDLIEHSSGMSFYKNKGLRLIDPKAELKKATDNDLLADFDGAKVAVIGAGLLAPESGSGPVRDTKSLQSLHVFWEQWLKASNAKLIKYGEPDWPTPVRWDDEG